MQKSEFMRTVCETAALLFFFILMVYGIVSHQIVVIYNSITDRSFHSQNHMKNVKKDGMELCCTER